MIFTFWILDFGFWILNPNLILVEQLRKHFERKEEGEEGKWEFCRYCYHLSSLL